MTEAEAFTMKIIGELEKMELEELKSFRGIWLNELEPMKLPELVLKYCSMAVDLVIEKKQDKLCSYAICDSMNAEMMVEIL